MVYKMKLTIDLPILPQYLNASVMEYIKTLAEQKMKGVCTEENGYITSVALVGGVKKNVITRANSDVLVTVDVEVECFKPEVGTEYVGKVCLIFPGGILVMVNDKLKVYISNLTEDGYKFVSTQLCYTSDKHSIKNGDYIKIKLLGVKFNLNGFTSFGKLIKDQSRLPPLP